MRPSRSVDDLTQAFARGTLTSRQVIEECLERIRRLDTGPAGFHAIIETNPDAIDIADVLDREKAVGHVRGPLHGVPVVVKDNIATADRMATTAGSLALVGAKVGRDAFLIEKLRAAGMVILAKANLTEWANIRSSCSISGWSGRGGQTRNPWDPARTPSGSSSGSAAAVAAGYAPLAIGTETNGSIVSPAGHCGIVGIKPTVGLVSRSGIIPISLNQDTAGPMAWTVRDAARLLTILAGDDPDDPRWSTAPARPAGYVPGTIDYAAGLDNASLAGARLGVWRAPLGKNEKVAAIFERALDRLRAAGAILVEGIALPDPDGPPGSRATADLLKRDLKRDLDAWFSGWIDPTFPVQSLADVVRFNRDHADQELPLFGQDRLEEALAQEAGGDEYDALRERVQRAGRADGIDRMVAEHGLDAIIAPTNGPARLIDPINGDAGGLGSSTPAAVAGYPIVTLPMGYAVGLPVNLSFIGPAYSEQRLIQLAHAWEAQLPERQSPDLASSVRTPGSILAGNV